MINEFLALKLPPNQNLWFQQDGAMAHLAVISVALLVSLLLQHLIFFFRVI